MITCLFPSNFSAVRKINELVKRVRLAKVHAYIIGHLKEQMPVMMGHAKKQAQVNNWKKKNSTLVANNCFLSSSFLRCFTLTSAYSFFFYSIL